jgi:hypothetical protein
LPKKERRLIELFEGLTLSFISCSPLFGIFFILLAPPYRQSLEGQQLPVRRILCYLLRHNTGSFFGGRSLSYILRRLCRTSLSECGGHLLTTGSASVMLCRRAIQLDSSYESHVAAAASFQTSAMGCCPYSASRSVGLLFQETRL